MSNFCEVLAILGYSKNFKIQECGRVIYHFTAPDLVTILEKSVETLSVSRANLNFSIAFIWIVGNKQEPSGNLTSVSNK